MERRMGRVRIGLGIVCCIIMMAAGLSAQEAPERDFAETGIIWFPDPPFAPDLSLPSLEEGVRNLEDFRGKLVLLNFWTNW